MINLWRLLPNKSRFQNRLQIIAALSAFLDLSPMDDEKCLNSWMLFLADFLWSRDVSVSRACNIFTGSLSAFSDKNCTSDRKSLSASSCFLYNSRQFIAGSDALKHVYGLFCLFRSTTVSTLPRPMNVRCCFASKHWRFSWSSLVVDQT